MEEKQGNREHTSMNSEQIKLPDRDESTLMVRHLIEVKNTRFLYTSKVHESISHHLVKGFNYSRFRKTDYIDVE